MPELGDWLREAVEGTSPGWSSAEDVHQRASGAGRAHDSPRARLRCSSPLRASG